MKTQHQPCDPHIIQRFVDRSLSENDQRDLETHLSACDACRKLLHRRIADNSFWDGLSANLRDSDYELSPLSTAASANGVEAGRSDVQHVLDLLAPTDDPNMLGRIGPYEISGVIGAGGMGIVLKGLDPSLNRVVAIKVMRHIWRGAARRVNDLPARHKHPPRSFTKTRLTSTPSRSSRACRTL